MDGTIVSSMHYWKESINEYLQTLFPDIDISEIIKTTMVMTLEEAIDYINNYFHKNVAKELFTSEVYDIMRRHYTYDIKMKEGAFDYLSKLKNDGCKLCVASSSPYELIELCMKLNDLSQFFDFYVSCTDIGIGKEHPDIFYLARDKFGLEKGDENKIAVFEDSLSAIKTAKKFGFYVVGVYDDFSKASFDDIKNNSDEVLKNFKI